MRTMSCMRTTGELPGLGNRDHGAVLHAVGHASTVFATQVNRKEALLRRCAARTLRFPVNPQEVTRASTFRGGPKAGALTHGRIPTMASFERTAARCLRTPSHSCVPAPWCLRSLNHSNHSPVRGTM